jgi:LPXTG-motif cell wall-anchored protein
VDLETITNDIPEIETYAESKGEKEDIKITENAVITDTVKYRDLKPGETYLLTGRLMDRKTGEAVKNSKGEIIVSQKEFKPIMSKGKVKVEFAFDARGLEGMDTVVLERLYDASGHIVAVHEDINDEGQTVSWEKPENEEPPEEEPPKEEPPEKEPPKKEPPHKEPPAKTPTIKKPPKTGDVSGLDIWAGLFTASAAAWIIVKRNKKGTRL